MTSRPKYVSYIDPEGNDGEREARRDRPFIGRWKLEDPDALREATGWPHANTRRVDRVEEAFVAELIHAGRLHWTSYARRKAWYAGATRWYLPRDFGYGPVINAVGNFDRLGFIDHNRKKPSGIRQRFRPTPSSHGYQSRLRASELFMAIVKELNPKLRCDPPRSLLILRNEDGHPIPFRETRWTRSAARKVAEIEEMLASARVDLAPETPCLWRNGDFLEVSDRNGDAYGIHIAHVPVARVFNGCFDHGGRFCGPPYQSWPKGVRPYITVNREPTEELDFGQTHLRMLCACAGLDIEAGDLFDIPGFDREMVKTTFYVLINATSLRSALLAVADDHKPRRKGDYAMAGAITEAIKKRFPALERYLHEGAGLRLMRRESDIAEDIMLNLARRGIVALPVHDSFVVEAKNAPILEEVMRDSWAKFVGSEADVSWKKKPSVSTVFR